MDFADVYGILCKNAREFSAGRKTEDEWDGYRRGVLDTLFQLDLTEEYYDWCDKHYIPTGEEEE